MATLGDDVWRHTIVLFTWGDRFPDISIEQHIESEGEALQWLVEKCRNRYHVFDNTDKKNRDQVTELLQKIDEMVAENSLFCFNTQCAAEVNRYETDTQQDEELSLNTEQLLTLMFQEMKNRHKEIKRKLEELGVDVTRCRDDESDRWSMEGPIQLKADEKLIEKIRREVSRWEAILTNGMLNIQNPEASRGELFNFTSFKLLNGNIFFIFSLTLYASLFHVQITFFASYIVIFINSTGETLIQSRNEMVLRWLQQYEEYRPSKINVR
ncbi:uncharacterized protein LOC122146656 isoform X1 [Cyprinus carpio]|uniref:Uncharacterized protein LOC122146656 isoform X1 n=1 Tax=Cyprinus carpio TaxID=7962 RepID=A0A9Q9YMD0_CYPCA|nr:uncharacterized protein LOC122146656 isoform X1 [Cyprinus carpio]